MDVKVKDSIDRVKSFELLDQALKLQMAKESDLSKIEKCLKAALDLDPNSLEALRRAALFYSTVFPDHEKAQKYAIACRNRAAQIVSEMEQIAKDRKQPASRHIGGIIGPY